MPTPQDFDDFDAYYEEAKGRIDDRIEEVMDEREEFKMKRHVLQHSVKGGKRVRPVLTLLVADLYDSPLDESLNHATIVELIHSASLVADDAYDEDATRRGAPALWKVLSKLPFGKRGHKVATGATIMAENGLLALAFQLVKDPDVADAVGTAMKGLVDGFFLEGSQVFSGVFAGGYDRYIETNKAKTGALFALSTWMPATYVDAPEEQVEAARKYGETIGVLYQVADDIADGDLPSYIESGEEELEKWYDEAVSYVDDMPPGEGKRLLRTAPAYMVYRMLWQEEMLADMGVSFIPEGVGE